MLLSHQVLDQHLNELLVMEDIVVMREKQNGGLEQKEKEDDLELSS